MTYKKQNLSELVNDESFLRWLRRRSTIAETKKWQKWYAESIHNRELKKKAEIIVNMPFKHADFSVDEVQTEKTKFERHFLRLVK